MKEKARYIFCTIINAFIISGIIILFIGLYYSAKSGIPYQDPPIELQIQYAVNMNIGSILVKTGFLTAICSSIVRAALGFIWKKQRKK